MDGAPTERQGGPRMAVMKAVVRGILVASLASTSAHGGSILFLGGNSVDSPTPSAAVPAPLLRLGTFSDSGPAALTPTPTASPIVPPASSPATSAPAPVAFANQSPPPSGQYDAFINLGTGPYPGSTALTTGNAQPWYLGSSVDRLFGGLPTIQQAAAFDETVLQRVQQTFGLSGIPVSLTNDPSLPAAHTISVVSQTSNPTVAGALGMTYLGGNGFQYIDTAANSATSVDQLEWIVAHNLAHELMLAFNVPEIHDQSGQFIDAPNASWSMMTSPTATFSPGAVADLLSKDFQATSATGLNPSAQMLGAPTVPEPSALVLWAVIGSATLVALRARRRAQHPPRDDETDPNPPA
jgi:hypothetical protein